jgi:hypothetical protein
MAKMFSRKKSPAAKATKAIKSRRRKGPIARLKRSLPGQRRRSVMPAVALGVGAVGAAALSVTALRAPLAKVGKTAVKTVGKRTKKQAVDKPADSAGEKVETS